MNSKELAERLNVKRGFMVIRSVHPRTLPIIKEYASKNQMTIGRAIDEIALLYVKPAIEAMDEEGDL